MKIDVKNREGPVKMEVNKKRYLKEGESISFSTVSFGVLLCTLIIEAHRWFGVDLGE